jgi:predicted cupin superfamily sugar epimerase
MHTAEYWVKHLDLQPHPEGGFYKECYRSAGKISQGCLPGGFSGDRSFCTSIYFLLRSADRSLFHRIKSDELWHFYAGSSLTLYVLDERGLSTLVLGSNPEKGESLQVTIPANSWFGAKVNQPESYVLSGCTVSPGFDFNDFEMGTRQSLVNHFPAQQEIIEMLT